MLATSICRQCVAVSRVAGLISASILLWSSEPQLLSNRLPRKRYIDRKSGGCRSGGGGAAGCAPPPECSPWHICCQEG